MEAWLFQPGGAKTKMLDKAMYFWNCLEPPKQAPKARGRKVDRGWALPGAELCARCCSLLRLQGHRAPCHEALAEDPVMWLLN